ncbi:MAG: formate transporter FocA [Planctomycetes bacterium]|nr:formate transporter FocA [Planctomycetota bacterium]MCW8134162.1 formate transporter FocA [Planctomycetota bacterium]
MTDPAHNPDALLPAEMAAKAEAIGVKKAALPFMTTFALAVLAGAFIALGAVFSTVATAGGGLAPGLTRVLGGVVFSLGLILVVVGGAELFTGNNLIVMAWANRQVSTLKLLRNWGIVYAGNLVGAMATAVLVYLSGHWKFMGGEIGRNALSIAQHKCSLGFVEALFLGVLCNALVCLAVWLTYSARSVADKVLAIVPPITAFVAAGFEHSIANMYFVPVAILIRDFGGREDAAAFEAVTWLGYGRNLLPVTLGNMIGGGVMVGIVYWFVYLRGRKPA